MPIIVDPQTRQRVLTSRHTGDIVYEAWDQTSDAVRNESIPVIGPWSDYTGSNAVYPNSKIQQNFAGISNELQGTDAQVENNAKLPPLNEVGQNAQTIRRRVRRIYRELTPEGKLK